MRFGSFAFASVLTATGACGDSKPATQFTVGITTQIVVPDDVQAVRITASSGGNRGFCQTYPVIDGKARLPQSLALAPDVASNPADQVTVTVMGFSVSKQRIDQEATFDDCTIPTVSPSDNSSEDPNSAPPNARVLRRSKQPYIDTRNLFLPMPLKYSCYGVNCPGDQTCKGGVCSPSEVDPKLLPEYDSALLYGTTSTCFDSNLCLADAVGVVIIDASQCIYEVPTGMSLKDIGMNVRVIYDPYRTEVLDLDPVEGFTIPDASAHPNRFQLAPGVCSGSGPKIKNVVASRTCPSKNGYQPLCASDSKTTTLAPAPSEIYLVVDQDLSMVDYLGPTIDPTSNLEVALGLALQDPVFLTTKVALRRVPDAGQECTSTTYGTNHPPFAPFDANASPNLLSPLFVGPISTSGLALDALLAPAGVYGVSWGPTGVAFNKRAVIVATNRLLDPSDLANCGPANAAAAVQAATLTGVDTYIFSLRNAFESPSAVTSRIAAAKAFALVSGAHVFSAEGDTASDPNVAKLAAAQGLAQIVSDVSSCVYTKPSNFTDPTQGTLTLKPGPFTPVPLTADSTCSTATSTANGWGLDQDTVHIRVCGTACATIRSAIATNQLINAQRNQSSPPSESNQVLVQLTVP